MILNREGASRRDDAPALPRSLPELGRFLRQERAMHGYTVEEVSGRTGLPQGILDAFESGTVDRLPDQVQTVKALRGYAEALGLPGNDYALLLIDLWPSYGGGPPVVVVQGGPATGVTGPGAAEPVAVAPPSGPFEGDTAMVPLATPLEAAAAAPVVAAAAAPPPAPPPAPVAPPVTTPAPPPPPAAPAPPPEAAPAPPPQAPPPAVAEGTVHRVGGTSPAPSTPGPLIFADTGVTPAVPAVHRRRRSRWLAVVGAVLVLALVVGVTGVVLDHVKPQWLHDVGIGSTKHQPTAAAHHHTTAPPPFALVSSNPTSATFAVREPSFVVKVVTIGGGSWVQASDAHNINPIFSGQLAANAQKAFTVTHSLTLQVGSTSARVFVSSGFKTLGFYFPPAAPFTLVFNQTG